MIVRILSLVMLCLSSLTVFGQVVINEYSASNLHGFQDNFFKTEDWIELYNNSDSEIDISGWFLSDKESNAEKWPIPSGTIMQPESHLVFFCSGRDGMYKGQYHTNFKLSQTKDNEFVQLADASGTVLESYRIELTLVEHSHARLTDGSDEWRISENPSYGTANEEASTFIAYTKEPSFDLDAGFYSDSISISITNNEPNSVLRITTDGTNPTDSSEVYSGPIQVKTTSVLKAQAFSNDSAIRPGRMHFATYLIDEDYSLAVFSVAADSVQDLANGMGRIIPIGSLEYFNTNKELEATSFGSLNRHGQDSWVLNHRSIDWVSRDEMGYSRAVEAPLFSYSERDSYQKFMFRNSGDDNYPALQTDRDTGEPFLSRSHEGSTHVRDEYVQTLAQKGGMELDLRAVERVILFLNGEYWGVYGMRERPVDHDYTDEYYDQGKYDVQYLSTWGDSEIEYGGKQAVSDWIQLRNFILNEDMANVENYEKVSDSLNVLSMIDYMLVNLNVVAKDWLNYNTGWWRGLNPDGDHKKWGYILWDLDAVFGYYINYTFVPDETPNAEPCDINEIASEMDEFFFNQQFGFAVELIEEPDSCVTVIDGSAPYPTSDSLFLATIAWENSCCDDDWDFWCQQTYDYVDQFGVPESFWPVDPEECPSKLSGEIPSSNIDTLVNQILGDVSDCCEQWSSDCQDRHDLFVGGAELGIDVGQHEKIFLKLLETNESFKQLYFQRYADMMNTVFSCENMVTTLDSMIEVITPVMPKQIERWGGSLTDWNRNVTDLRQFILRRCARIERGALSCYPELDGAHKVTLMTEPDGIGEIDFNTLDIEAFPWEGNYFGGMDNKIKAKVFNDFEDEYVFSHWESSSSNVISPDLTSRKATIRLTESDTLTAVFQRTDVAVSNIDDEIFLNVFPNPVSQSLYVEYEFERALPASLALYNALGQELLNVARMNNSSRSSGTYVIELDQYNIPAGLYDLVVTVDGRRQVRKVNIVR